MSQFGHTPSAEVESGHGPTLNHLLQQTKNHKLKGSVCIADDAHVHACNLKSKTEKELNNKQPKRFQLNICSVKLLRSELIDGAWRRPNTFT